MSDLYLAAGSEAALAGALPMLRAPLSAGAPTDAPAEGWVSSSPLHALAAGFPVVVVPAVLEGMVVVEPAVLAEGFHLNIRLSPRHPAYDEIVTAAAPFRVTPSTPALVFEGEADWSIPDGCSKLGLVRALREVGEWAEVRALLASDPDLQEEWDLATELKRSDPLVQGVIAARGYPPDRVDRLIVRATDLVA